MDRARFSRGSHSGARESKGTLGNAKSQRCPAKARVFYSGTAFGLGNLAADGADSPACSPGGASNSRKLG